MNKPIERKLVFQEVLKFIIFTCSIPVQLIQGVNNAIHQINLYPILHWPVLDLKEAASSLSTVTN